MDEGLGKFERVNRIWILLLNNPFHFTTKSLSEKFGVSIKTILRDIEILGSDEMGVPIDKEGNRWGIKQGHMLPPVCFSETEAVNIFLSLRLFMDMLHRYNPNIESTFDKLNTALPKPLRDQVQNTLEWMQQLPWDENYLRIMTVLARAWLAQRQVRITYQSLSSAMPEERIIDPYFIQPSASEHSCYVIALCHLAEEIRTFKVERIIEIKLLPEIYTIPATFNANDYLGSSFGITINNKVETVKLRIIAPEIVRLMEEAVWHPSQKLTKKKDGSAVMTFRVCDTYELFSWIMGWGEKVEVLSPVKLRKSIANSARTMLKLYGKS